MKYIDKYQSPLGEILLASDGEELTGLWFEGQKNYAKHLNPKATFQKIPIFSMTKAWLDYYFAGKEPYYMIPAKMGGTAFMILTWRLIDQIPYGQTTTYSEIAKAVARYLKLPNMSARAVSNAIAQNPISIIIPCHRVIGSDGSLKGYAGGIDRKKKLLELEKANLDHTFIPDEILIGSKIYDY